MKHAHITSRPSTTMPVEDEWKFEVGAGILGGSLLRQAHTWRGETDTEWSATLWLHLPWGRGHNFSVSWGHGYPDRDTDWPPYEEGT